MAEDTSGIGSYFNNLMADPMFNFGLSLMSQWKTPPGQYPSLSNAMQQFQGWQQAQQASKLQAMKMEEMKLQQEAQRKAQEALGKLPGLRQQYTTPAAPGAIDQGKIGPGVDIGSEQANMLAGQMVDPQNPLADLMAMNQSANFPMQGTAQELPLQGRPEQFNQAGYKSALSEILSTVNPLQFAQEEYKAMQPEQPKYEKVGNELVQVNAPGGPKQVYAGADTRQPKHVGAGWFMKPDGSLYKDEGLYRDLLAEKRAGGTQVSVGAPMIEREESKAKGKWNVEKLYGPVAEQAVVARKLNAQLDSLDRVVGASGWKESTFAPAANALSSLGLAPESAKELATSAQTFNAAAMDLVLQKQLAQKGPQTESDAVRLQQSLPKFSNTVEANRYLIDFARAQNNRDIKAQKFMDSYWRRNGTYEGAEESWYAGEGGKSLFDEPNMTKWANKTSATKPAGNYSDPDKERRYQEWKARQGK